MVLNTTVNLSDIGNRIGLMGGTFDPIHLGHLAAARAAFKELHLDAVVFVPSYIPPHKYATSILSFKDRLAMLDLAISSISDYFISEIEEQRGGRSFTWDTLIDLREQIGDQKDLFFITGVDAFMEIHTWKNFTDLLNLTNFTVISRPPNPEKNIKHYIKGTFSGFCYHANENSWKSPLSKGSINLITIPPVDVSSTQIRQLIISGDNFSDFVPDSVADYIIENDLYLK